MRSAFVGILSSLVLAFAPEIAGAAEEPARILLIDPNVPALERRLREEIEALGIAVALAPAGETDEPLEERARAAQTIGAVRLSRTGAGAVEIVIVDRATGKTVSRRLTIATPSDPASTELVATRTVELLRASLMELDAPHPPRGDAPVPAELRELAQAENDAALALAVGPAAVYASGFGTAFDVWGAVSFRLSSASALTASFVVPVTSRYRTTPAGELENSESQFRLGGSFDVARLAPVLAWRLEAGLSLALLTVDGSARGPYVAERERTLAWGPWLGAGLAFSVTRDVAVLAAADAAVAFPRTAVRAAGNELGPWGQPLVTARLGAELEWR